MVTVLRALTQTFSSVQNRCLSLSKCRRMGGGSSKTDPAAKKMAQEFVDEEIKKPAVVFSKSYCPFCKMAKAVLNEVGAKYTVHELDERGDGDAIQDYLLKITGARSVPRVFVGQQCIGGGTETREAHEKGTLVPLLKKAGALTN